MRLFAAALLPEPVVEHLAGALAPLMPEGTRALTPLENWHITLAFYGDVPAGAADELSTAVAEAVWETSALRVHLSGSGWFRHATAWIGVGGQAKELAAVMAALNEVGPRASVPEKHRPHLTIARTGRRSGGPVPALDRVIAAMSVYRGPDWTVDEVMLMRSELGQGRGGRPRYTPFARAALRP